jgi:hypothetical protein
MSDGAAPTTGGGSPGGPPPDSGLTGASDGSSASYMVPNGLSAVILAFCIFFSLVSFIVVFIRVWIRGRSNILGWDDGLMVSGLVLFLVAAGLASYATFQGLGSPNSEVSSEMKVIGLKVRSATSTVGEAGSALTCVSTS